MIKQTYVKSRKVYKLTFEVPEAELPEGDVESLTLVGSFNDWREDSHSFKLTKKKIYKATIEVIEPGTYQFRYLLNGATWVNAWQADGYELNEHGTDNCLIIVGKP